MRRLHFRGGARAFHRRKRAVTLRRTGSLGVGLASTGLAAAGGGLAACTAAWRENKKHRDAVPLGFRTVQARAVEKKHTDARFS
jgi:hypothetical protein